MQGKIQSILTGSQPPTLMFSSIKCVISLFQAIDIPTSNLHYQMALENLAFDLYNMDRKEEAYEAYFHCCKQLFIVLKNKKQIVHLINAAVCHISYFYIKACQIRQTFFMYFFV